MAVVALHKRASSTDAPLTAKKPLNNPISVTVLKSGDVQFDYNGRIAQLSLVKLKEVSLYFISFFSGNWQQKSVADAKYELIKPDGDFSPSLFMDLMHAYADPKVVLEFNSREAVLSAVKLIQFYGFKGPFRIKNSDFFILNYENIKDILHIFDELAQIIDRKKLAVQCCQAILDEPGFMDHCLFAPQARKFLSQGTLDILRLFNKIRDEIISLEIEVNDAEKKAEEKKSLLDSRSRTLRMTACTSFLEQVLSLFPNLQEIKLNFKDAKWNELIKASYFIENHDNNPTIQMLNNKFSHHFKHLRSVTTPVKNCPPIVLKFMNNKTYILEFNCDENICIYQRSSDTSSYTFAFIVGYQSHFPQVEETLIGELLSFPPSPELLEGIDASRLPWTEDGKMRPGWGVHRPN